MNRFVLEKNAFKAFEKTVFYKYSSNQDLISNNLDNLDNNFKILFSTLSFLINSSV